MAYSITALPVAVLVADAVLTVARLGERCLQGFPVAHDGFGKFARICEDCAGIGNALMGHFLIAIFGVLFPFKFLRI